tara:strand:+ start:1007 stop:1537 length:531 start_codon:yes stop_codon:yes gene_type:complete
MTKTQFEVKGINQLKNRLDLANMSAKPIRKLMREQGQIIRKQAKKEAPKFSGSLSRSIHVQRIKSKGRLPQSVKIYSSRSYAKFVHGDEKISGKLSLKKPFTRSVPHFPPVKKLKPWADAKGLNVYAVQRSIGKKGTPLVPFFLIAEKKTRIKRNAETRKTAKQIEREYRKGRING